MTGRSFPLYRIATFMLCVMILFFIGNFCFFAPRTEMLDELSLFNPVYLYSETGQMVYPAHGFFDAMVPHPPTHYYIVGGLMKLGIPFFYASVLPYFGMVCFVMALILLSKFRPRNKLGFLMGLTVPIFIGLYIVNIQSLRPDMFLALTWYGGLIALEAGRRQNWHRGWLFLGALLTALAAALHYFAFPALLGTLIFGLAVLKEKGWTRIWHYAWPPLLATLLIWLPYAFGFILPNLEGILGQVAGKGAATAGGVAFESHFRMYEELVEFFPWVQTGLMTGIPLFLFGLVFALFIRETRVFALAGLPLTGFIFLASALKTGGYFAPELTYWFASFGVFMFGAIDWLSKKFNVPERAPEIILVWVLILINGGMDQHNWALTQEFKWEARRSEFYLARAAGKKMLGPEAKVAGKLGTWFISGANEWHDLSKVFIEREDIAGFRAKAYFTQFDAVAEHNAMSNYSVNRQHRSLSSYYADSTLNLLGFYATPNGDEISDLSYLLFHPEPKQDARGFAHLRGDSIQELMPTRAGKQAFFALNWEVGQATDSLKRSATHFIRLFLPNPNFPPMQEDYEAERCIIWGLMPWEKWELWRENLPLDCFVRDEIRLSARTFHEDELADFLRENDGKMNFVRPAAMNLSEYFSAP